VPKRQFFLEEDVWLGANVIVLKGTRIARGAVLAACSVVTNNEPPYEMWAGVPARKIGERPVEP
jgi:acetyltransferase-like isoleucine patch superfamily enzyme